MRIHQVRCFLRDIINSHEETLDPSEVRDVIDALLVESQKSDRCDGAFAKENLLVCSLDLFTGEQLFLKYLSYWFWLNFHPEKWKTKH